MSASQDKIFPSRITAWLSVGLAAIILLFAAVVAPIASASASAGITNAGLHPWDTATGLYNQAQATALNFAQGDAFTRGKYLGYGVSTVAVAVVSDGLGDASALGGGANALVDTGATSEIVGAGDAGANIAAVPYGDLSGTLPEGFQANHLNQNAAFGSAIPQQEGLAVGMRGNAITDVGTPHYNFHQSLEQFWSRYRRGGALFQTSPTNAEYGESLRQALQASGYSAAQASDLAAQAAAQRAAYGLNETAAVPNVPGRLNQVKP